MRHTVKAYMPIGLFVVALTVAAPEANCEPVVSAALGIWSQGNTITVSGSGFGNTGKEVPIKFDDFEGGNVGSSLATGGWSVSSDNGPDVPEYSSTRSWSGSKCGYADISMGGDSAAYLTNCNAESFYVSLMFYFVTYSSPSTSKGVRVNAHDGPNVYTSYPGVFIQDYHRNNRHTIKPDDEASTGSTAYTANLSTGQWYRLEYWFKMSSPAGSTNGEVDGWQDLSHTSDWSGITRASGVTDKWQTCMLPFYYGNGGTGENWYDDVYISKSKARVELGNSSTWSGCSTRQIQGATSWSTNAISLRANQGSFADGTAAYLYVVDADGAVNSAGYPITIGLVQYTLTVTNGSGSGDYDENDVVPISASPAPAGKAFAAWMGDYTYVADRLAASTTVTMPATDISVTAAYAWVYELTVNSGTGDGQYFAATVVDIQADPAPSGTEFDGWTGDIAYVADTQSSATTVTMPSSAVEVTATFASTAIPGDLNDDGWVGQPDLDIILDQWGCGDPPKEPITDPRADANGDGWVGQPDLDIVLDHWGQSL